MNTIVHNKASTSYGTRNYRILPYHDENTCSRQITEVKHRRARLVPWLETTQEHRVLNAFYWQHNVVDTIKRHI